MRVGVLGDGPGGVRGAEGDLQVGVGGDGHDDWVADDLSARGDGDGGPAPEGHRTGVDGGLVDDERGGAEEVGQGDAGGVTTDAGVHDVADGAAGVALSAVRLRADGGCGPCRDPGTGGIGRGCGIAGRRVALGPAERCLPLGGGHQRCAERDGAGEHGCACHEGDGQGVSLAPGHLRCFSLRCSARCSGCSHDASGRGELHMRPGSR